VEIMMSIAALARALTVTALAVMLTPTPLSVSAQSGQTATTTATGTTARTGTPTFNRDVAPLLYENCATCHRTGEVAPFPLLTYEDVAKRARIIAAVTAARVMPPWKAEPGHGSFLNERRLTDAQIALLKAWAEAGAPEGDAKDKPLPPKFPEGWQAGEPDQVVSMTDSHDVAADGPDDFRCFVLPLNLERDVNVSGFEFRPGNKRVVHHAIIYVDSTGAGRRLAARSNGGGYRCVGGPGFAATGAIGGWAPGADPRREDPETALAIPKGSDLVVQIHYHPSGKREQDRSSLGLHYSGPATRGRAGMVLVNRRIYINPGDSNYVVEASAVVPRDVDLVGITPHAHFLATDMKVDAHLPDGRVTPLIWIKDWDFNWQGQYRYAAPVHLPKGTRLQMRYVYDNSNRNPRNPASPPRLVTWGEETNDEMAIAFLEFVLPSPADVPAFRTSAMLQAIESFLAGGGGIDDVPPGVAGGAAPRLRQAFQLFDRNRDGKLDDQERTALMELVRRLVPEQ
jgi:mono/diheme cytochrome c family protein